MSLFYNLDPRCRRTRGVMRKSTPPPFSSARLKSFFKSFDRDQDGRLSKEELKNAFSSLGSQNPARRSLGALHYADKNGDGFVSEEELEDLVQYAEKHGYKIEW